MKAKYGNSIKGTPLVKYRRGDLNPGGQVLESSPLRNPGHSHFPLLKTLKNADGVQEEGCLPSNGSVQMEWSAEVEGQSGPSFVFDHFHGLPG